MGKVTFSLLRGICQIPAYVAYEMGFFRDEGVDVEINIEPTAWMIPNKLTNGESHFAVIPWTRVATAEEKELRLVLLAGSGYEEAAIVIRKGIRSSDVKKVVIPQRGGMKDLTAIALIEHLGWKEVEIIRQPSGDGAIISFLGGGADAASMVEPYATMMELMGVGSVIKRTGDIWQGAPGCSLTTTFMLKEAEPDLVQRIVNAFVRGTFFTRKNKNESARIAYRYIGINESFIRKALDVNLPDINAIRNKKVMEDILYLMANLGYIRRFPANYIDLAFLDKVDILGD